MSIRSPRAAQTLQDPRHFQIVALSALVIWGRSALGIDIRAEHLLVAGGASLLTEALGARLRGRRFDPRSPLISSLSLCLLARTASLGFLAATAVVAIGSKFVLRARGKHVFNPTNFGIVTMWMLTDGVWVSPGQWGRGAVVGVFCVLFGAFVIHRAVRSDVTLSFLSSYALLLGVRAFWLGDPLEIAAHSLQSGALLIFAFFMISDPRTTPRGRAMRMGYGALVAAVGAAFQFGLHEPNGFLCALIFTAPLVPAMDAVAERMAAWPASARGQLDELKLQEDSMPTRFHRFNSRALAPRLSVGALFLSLLVLLLGPAPGNAFCGFYVAKADTKLFNKASQVVLVRDGDRTVVTMASDYRGDLKEFAMVIPVPTFLEREQIHVAEQSLIDHLDTYTSPRLVEYFDENPCWRRRAMLESTRAMPMSAAPVETEALADAQDLGVTIEAKYTVGEYDILILNAEESEGLLTFLQRSGYRLPGGAKEVLGSYLKQGMRFFVAKVNLDEQSKLGFANLRPIQVAYESPKFMLPIRLGTVNADGAQELFVYALTRKGRVETTNYRTVRLPTGQEIPAFVKDDFGSFYKDMFNEQVKKDGMQSVFLEYAWDMSWCDPCAANPLSPEQLRQLGVFWQGEVGKSQARDVFVTRLHVRYDREHFPQDLRFQQTSDRQNFQGRYVLRHAWNGDAQCSEAREYLASLDERFDREAQTLARLTGWDIAEIRERIDYRGRRPAEPVVDEEKWWQKLWPGR
ncbi:MAG: DUF2330 domain-containing protein [Acidobacteriota bacterium]